MTPISDRQLNSYFTSFKRYAFRLEVLDSYSVPDHDPEFRAYLSGKPLPPDRDAGWFDLVRSARAGGRFFRRIHIIPEILTDYLRYEIEWGYCYTAEAGEEICLLTWREDVLSMKEVLSDFWLFDDNQLVFMRYDDNGKLVARELLEEEEVVRQYVDIMKRLWKVATPLQMYLSRVRSGRHGTE